MGGDRRRTRSTGPVMDRRTLLMLLAGGGGAAALAACGNDSPATTPSSPTAAASTSTTAPPTTVPTTVPMTAAPLAPISYDPNTALWVQGNYASVTDEIEAFDLVVEGALPPELTGLYVRNGSNPKIAGGHWFLGDGMVHGVRLEGGRASWYRNRWVQTSVLGRDLLDSGGAPGGENNTSNTSCITYEGRLLSLQEVGYPYELDPADLSTIGPWNASGTMVNGLTAHPKLDPATGKLHCFVYGFVEPYLTYYVIGTDGNVEHSTTVPVPGGTMIHDFAITDRDVVFWDLPVVFSMQTALERPGEMPFGWDPAYGARVWVMPLGGTGDQARSVEIDPCYVFHGTNAWREGDDVVVDVSWMPDAFVRGRLDGPDRDSLRRWRLGTGGASLTFAEEILVDRSFDLPTIRRDQTGRPHDTGFYVHSVSVPGGFQFAGIAGMDRVSGAIDEWTPSDAESSGEPLVVGDWVLVYVYDRSRDASDLAVFAADDLASGPVARVKLPRRVPYGFHATWVEG
jgi:carotenoid cleavage dioxygenase-like enzyme